MRRTLVTLAIISFAIFFLAPTAANGAKIELKKQREFNFENAEKLQSVPLSICKTPSHFVIPQPDKNQVGVFQKNGLGILTRPMGIAGSEIVFKHKRDLPKEHVLAKPVFNLKIPGYSSYASLGHNAGIYCIADMATGRKNKAAYLYEVNGASFSLKKRIEGVDAYDLAYWSGGNQLVVSGYIREGNDQYSLYMVYPDLNDTTRESIHVDETDKTMLLETHAKFGHKKENFMAAYSSGAIPALGIRAFIDVTSGESNYVFFAYEAGGMNILRINLNNPDDIKEFGKETGYFLDPKKSEHLEDLIKAYSHDNVPRLLMLRKRMSFIRDIWATQKHVLVLYKGAKNSPESSYRLQIYTIDGKYLDDKPVSGDPYHRMFFDKESYKLYYLSKKTTSDDLRIKELKISIEN